MATFDADIERAVAIELKEKILSLYISVLPVFRQSSLWTLNGTDPMLPAPYDVKLQIASYKTLRVETLKLSEWVTLLLTAQVGDTLTYPPLPEGSGLVFFDEHLIFSETLIF
jgi:hypothetical protein